MPSSAATRPTIVRSSPQAKSQTSTHPRRAPPNQSVSLLHSKAVRPRLQSTISSDSEKAQAPSVSYASTGTDSPSSLQALGGKNSSGETSNAENWFDKSNNEVRDSSTAFVDNDPPFFMRNSSSESPPDSNLRKLSAVDHQTHSLPLRTELLQLGTDGSSVDDYRGVIDDLTVENKKLKRRLKKYEKFHDSHLKNDKLFEVRFHGLPPEKKRELEETLQKFASSLDTTGTNAFPADGYSSLLPMLKTAKTVSSQTSLQNADSAYASMSASGQGSSAQSGIDGKQTTTPRQYMAARRQNIHSYLHHIPEGLMPQSNPTTMTERAKQKLVVRRMEQLFAGKGAISGGPQQSIQQQEVSQTAARADRSALEARGQRAGQEGSREANIMNQDADEQMSSTERIDQTTESNPSDKRRLPVQKVQKSLPETSNADQRPTRPLDLDPHRAQVPSENIRYMRQMGFSPQDPGADRSPEEGHSWIYLNFLINMAQLHTINVTQEFIRKALTDHSNKLEVSSDGRKVRWKGGESLTRNSSSGGGSSNEHISDDTTDGQSPRKRPKFSHTSSSRSNVNNGSLLTGAAARLRSEHGKHMYTPIFSHKDETDEDVDLSSGEEEDGLESPPYPIPMAGDSSGRTSSGIRANSGILAPTVKRKPKRDDGPVIFYNNARFCTDLSGDGKTTSSNDGPRYIPASSVPVGHSISTTDRIFEKRGPLAEASDLPEPMDLSDNPIPESMEISFPPDSPSKSSSSSTKGQEPLEFEVTGIGGVWPADNFSISVESRHTSVPEQRSSNHVRQVETKALPPRVRHILENSGITPKTHPVVNKHFVASAVKGLPPSELPPALSFLPFDDESEEEDSDVEDDVSEAPPSPGALPPSAALQRVDLQYALSEDEDDSEDDEEDEEEDDEVDFLAAARQVDPEAVRQQEREYDANMAERLAEEIPAGSSAATAGGGSGFGSPADGAERDETQRPRREARAKLARMGSRKTSGSMVTQQEKPGSFGSDSDEEADTMSNIRS